jgi:hypothetical protein
MTPEKAFAIENGESAGEAAAREMFAKGGVAALAATLEDGAETWAKDAKAAKLAASAGVDEDYRYAFNETYARGARRVADAIVSGERDGERYGANAKHFGECLKRFTDCRQSVVQAYAEAYARGAARSSNPMAPGETISVSLPAIVVNPAIKSIGG